MAILYEHSHTKIMKKYIILNKQLRLCFFVNINDTRMNNILKTQ